MPIGGGSRRAAFIDRDGVINEERDYVCRIEDFRLLPGVIEGLAQLREAGYVLVVVTNQSGIGRGLYTETDYKHLTQHMQQQLAVHGVELDAVYHCPHHPTAGIGEYRRACTCRKPQPGMLMSAARELGLSLPDSVLIGDKASDIEAGRGAGVGYCVLVESGHALSAVEQASADACVADLQSAARWLTAAN